ncbi:17943_t:CDS:1, partial [Funneliformis geosporum]
MSEDESELDDLLISEIFEDYSPLKYELYQDEKEEVTIDDQFAWILLWIMNFRIRFNVPETAIVSLIKFIKLVLTEIGSDKFNRFP